MALIAPVMATVLIWVMLGGALIALGRAPAYDRPWLALPLGLYAGWLTAASSVALATVAAGYGIGGAATLSWVGLVLALLIAVAVSQRFGVPTYPLAVAWALAGIVATNLPAAPVFAGDCRRPAPWSCCGFDGEGASPGVLSGTRARALLSRNAEATRSVSRLFATRHGVSCAFSLPMTIGINAPGLEILHAIATEVAGPKARSGPSRRPFEQSGVGHCISYVHPHHDRGTGPPPFRRRRKPGRLRPCRAERRAGRDAPPTSCCPG